MLLAATVALSSMSAWIQGANPPVPSLQEIQLTTYKMAGRDVPATIPAADPIPFPGTALIAFNGWNYLVGDKGALLGRMKGMGGWGDVQALYSEAKAKFTDATPAWRLKAVVFTRLDDLDVSKEGVLRQRRYTLEDSMVDRALRSLARCCATIEAYAGGRFRVVPDVEIENDPIHIGPPEGAIDDQFVRWYFGPRINGGEFDAGDKVYRGPYDSVLFIHAGTAGDGQPTCDVNGMPVTGIAYEPKDDGTPTRNLAEEELAACTAHLEIAAAKWGIPAGDALIPEGIGDKAVRKSPEDLLLGAVWAQILARIAPTTDDRIAILSQKGKPVPMAWSAVADDPWRKLPWLEPTDVAKFAGKAGLVDVGQPGKFHSYVLTSTSDQVVAPRTDVPELGLAGDVVEGRESLALLTYGARALLLVPGRVATLVGAKLKPELDAKAIGAMLSGGEELVVFDLKVPEGAKTEIGLLDLSTTPATDHAAGPDHYDGVVWSIQYAPPVVYSLAPGTEPDANSDKPEARALAAAKLTESSAEAQRAAVVAMLGVRDDFIRLNAAQAFARVKEPTAEAALTELAGVYNTRVAAVALRALAFQGTDTAWATVEKTMKVGHYDYCCQVAAKLIGARNDPKLSLAIAGMFLVRSWQARLAGAEAVGIQKDLASQHILSVFYDDVDPAVRLAAIKAANVELDPIANHLQWPAVNDASDEVRTWSYIGLIHSGKEEYRKDGYKGVRDDSIPVRLAVLHELESRPSPNHRDALRLAATDTNAVVRAAALSAFAKQPGDLSLDDISGVMSDKDPLVQKALVGLAKAKSLKLPAPTLAMLRASVDPGVAAEAKELAD